MKFNVGDKVRVKRGLIDGEYSSHHIYCNDEMEELVGTILTISESHNDYSRVKENQWTWDNDFLEPFGFDKELITDLSVVTLNNGDKLIYKKDKDEFIDLSIDYDNNLCEISDVNEDGSIKKSPWRSDLKIVKIEQPVYSTVYAKEDVKEMTVEEISKALGYEVKIVKEK